MRCAASDRYGLPCRAADAGVNNTKKGSGSRGSSTNGTTELHDDRPCGSPLPSTRATRLTRAQAAGELDATHISLG